MISMTGIGSSAIQPSNWMTGRTNMQMPGGERINGAGPPTKEQGQEHLWSAVEPLAEEAGLDEDQMSNLKSDLLSAVSSVADGNGAEGMSPDLMEKIHSSVTETLGQYGIDSADLPQPGGPGGMRPPSGMGAVGDMREGSSEASLEDMMSMLPFDTASLQSQTDGSMFMNAWSFIDEEA